MATAEKEIHAKLGGQAISAQILLNETLGDFFQVI